MSKAKWFGLLAALISLLLAGAPAGAGGKGQGQGATGSQNGGQTSQQGKWDNGQPPGWSQGQKTGWKKQNSSKPPGLQKKDQLPQGLQKSR